MSRGELSTVEQYTGIIEQLLIKARLSKPLGQINPPLTVQDIADGIQSIAELSAKLSGPAYASIETACREIFYRRLVS